MNAALTLPFESWHWPRIDWRGLWNRALRFMDDLAREAHRKALEARYFRTLQWRRLMLKDPLKPFTVDNMKPEARDVMLDLQRICGLLASPVRATEQGVDPAATFYHFGRADVVKLIWEKIGAPLPDVVAMAREQEEMESRDL